MARKRAPASRNSQLIDQLCDALVPKLAERVNQLLPSKQVVVGSTPISRSN
jgi:hypothetical protein